MDRRISEMGALQLQLYKEIGEKLKLQTEPQHLKMTGLETDRMGEHSTTKTREQNTKGILIE